MRLSLESIRLGPGGISLWLESVGQRARKQPRGMHGACAEKEILRTYTALLRRQVVDVLDVPGSLGVVRSREPHDLALRPYLCASVFGEPEVVQIERVLRPVRAAAAAGAARDAFALGGFVLVLPVLQLLVVVPYRQRRIEKMLPFSCHLFELLRFGGNPTFEAPIRFVLVHHGRDFEHRRHQIVIVVQRIGMLVSR
jgi:hypothetical protein